ncbi:TPA: hypothetical protein ACPDS2_000631 [Pasteurella multocida]|uniref:hypothetical protein n=1 Tax=Pasteurella multocida TaxID=747 RepID=UPI000C9B93A5|nr:hypothetical protein [Pasteurella multocida]QDA13762.1 hypothetical protein E0Z11_01575 [Pasteurella multocida subsp. multocida]MDY0488823.1 hypothetical protein [Pasteurella multocida]MDY0595356.1 hypothetical protein [Pasteurella multocida]MDY0664728.1 hypothetical protein [Pasteurella multocida]MDY0666823.1 hypothetical protein [Pasteurella multocida]
MRNSTQSILITKNAQERMQSHSLQLIDDLLLHFNIPAYNPDDNSQQGLLNRLAFLSVCYHAFFLELKDTPIKQWIDKNLSDVYAHNANYPLIQTLEKIVEIQGGKTC